MKVDKAVNLEQFMDGVIARNPGEVEFHQAVHEVAMDVVPYIADREWAMPMVEGFDWDFHDIKSLTWPARHVDRLLLPELDRNDWKSIVAYIEKSMTDEVMEEMLLRYFFGMR